MSVKSVLSCASLGAELPQKSSEGENWGGEASLQARESDLCMKSYMRISFLWYCFLAQICHAVAEGVAWLRGTKLCFPVEVGDLSLWKGFYFMRGVSEAVQHTSFSVNS